MMKVKISCCKADDIGQHAMLPGHAAKVNMCYLTNSSRSTGVT